MQYYIERGNNIETPDQMYDAMCKATTLSGFTANVVDVKERKFYAKTKKINNISKIHLKMITVIKVKQSSMFGNTVILVKEKYSTYLPNQKC